MKLSEIIVDRCIERNIIQSGERSVYVYGTSLIINDIICFASILILSALIDNMANGAVFLAVFYLLRVRCGGFHAKTVWVCRITMAVTYMAVFAVSKATVYTEAQSYITVLGILSLFCIIPIIPVENPNKPLCPNIKKRNKIQAIILIFAFSAAAAVFDLLKCSIGIVISSTMTAVAVLAVIGYKINKTTEVKNDENYR